MTDWLKNANPPKKVYVIDVQVKVRAADSEVAIEVVESSISNDSFAHLFGGTGVTLIDSRVVDTAANHMEAESSLFDNPEYQREQENKGDSGCFDESHILDNKPDFSNDSGPASTTPGAPGTSVAPGTGIAEGLFD